MFKKILVPLDFSDYTDEIMNVAAPIAEKFGSTIHLLHVIPNMDYFTPYESFLPAENLVSIQRDIEREVGKDMEAVAKNVKDITCYEGNTHRRGFPGDHRLRAHRKDRSCGDGHSRQRRARAYSHRERCREGGAEIAMPGPHHPTRRQTVPHAVTGQLLG